MERYFLDILAGRRDGAGTALLRGALGVLEIPYTAVVRLRNGSYDRGLLGSRRLPRPTVSVGNITTGGTGKTPMVCWLAARLGEAGRRPAVLMRGYKGSDEQIVIARANPNCRIVANPDRGAGAGQALKEDGQIDTFILDDGMQHRRVRRDVEIVLVNAREPWGFGRVLPRGLLREPLTGLGRADVIVITHIGEVPPDRLREIEATVRQYNSGAPILRADHLLTGLAPFSGAGALPMPALNGKTFFAACGIGSPESFESLLSSHGGRLAGKRYFADHHPFSDADAVAIDREARECGAEMIIVTEKDWTKLREFKSAGSFFFANLEMRFAGDDGQTLLNLVLERARAS